MNKQLKISVQTPIENSFRVQQIAGIFDVSIQEKMKSDFLVDIPPDLSQDWKIGLIVGSSGSGKSTVAKHFFEPYLFKKPDWSSSQSILDNFGNHPVREIISTLTMVGLSSPPCWIKPYNVLSNGEQFRCDLAKALLDSHSKLVVFDEFTSVVDRTVAKVAAAAISKNIKNDILTKRFVAVTCHYDVEEWLLPDWTLNMSTGQLQWRSLRRPTIELKIFSCSRNLWKLFKKHHYLNSSLGQGAVCYTALWNQTPVAFCGVLPLMGYKNRRRIARIVTLPDFQGIGIGSKFMDAVGELYHNNKQRLNITASHPSVLKHCIHSPQWKTISVRKTGSQGIGSNSPLGSLGRAVVSFEYIGKY